MPGMAIWLLGGIRRKDAERAVSRPKKSSKMALIERQDIVDAVPVCQHDDRRIGQADVEVGVAVHDPRRSPDITWTHDFQPECACADLSQQGVGSRYRSAAPNQVVELGQDEWREQQRAWGIAQRRCRGGMVPFPGIERGQQTARIDEDHGSPNPSSSSSVRDARSGWPLSKSGRVSSAIR